MIRNVSKPNLRKIFENKGINYQQEDIKKQVHVGYKSVNESKGKLRD